MKVRETAQRLFNPFWHLRRLPPATDEASRAVRLRWCRDHCADIGGHWFIAGFLLIALPGTPFVAPFVGSSVAWLLPLGAVVCIGLGVVHIVWQIVAQSRIGPPPIEPPAEMPEREEDKRERPRAGRRM